MGSSLSEVAVTGRATGVRYSVEAGIFILATNSNPVKVSSDVPIQCVSGIRRPKCEIDHIP